MKVGNVQLTAFHAVLGFAFCAGVSMPLARAFLVLALVLVAQESLQGRLRWRLTPTAWAWIAYIGVAVVVTACVAATLPEGALIAPAKGLRKIDKLLWYAGALVLPLVISTADQFRKVLLSFVLGCAVYSVAILVLHPIGAWIIAHFSQKPKTVPWNPPEGSFYHWFLTTIESLGLREALEQECRKSAARGSYNKALAFMSGMGAGQRLMAGSLTALAVAFLGNEEKKGLGRLSRWASSRWVLFLVMAGLLITLKRGSLLVFLAIGGVVLLRKIGWKRGLVAVAAVALLALALPASRTRLSQLPNEFSLEKGGRVLMWTNLAPAIHKQYPWGVGFRGLTYHALSQATEEGRYLELNQNHLHNNFAQVLVELGWTGIAVYLGWMALAFSAAIRQARKGMEKGGLKTLVLAAPLMVLAGLFLNGFVEYNLADGEVALIYGLMMGLATTSLKDSQA